MAAWSRLRTSFSSLPTTSPSSSPPSSSASLHPSLLLDLADELWFYRSVLPPLSLPCLPALFSFSSSSSSSSLLSPDPSTLIAQCMITNFSPSSPHLPPSSSSSSSSSSPPPGSDPSLHTQYLPWGLPAYHDYPPPHSNGEDEKSANQAYNENAYRWYASTSDSDSDDDDEDDYGRYPRPGAGEDEDAYHYYTATSDWDDEDAYHGYAAHSDCEDEQQIEREDAELGMVLPVNPPKLGERREPDDALSGIYDVADLLKNQHYKASQEVSDKSATDSQFVEDAVSVVSALPHLQVASYSEQAAMKENIKLWAHAVALTLPWKAAAKARPLL